MFGWNTSVGLPSMATEPDKERRPPPPPTPLEFPLYNLSDVAQNESDSTLHELYSHLVSIKRPQDISAERFRALNVKVEPDVPASCIVPEECMKSLPPLPWEALNESAEQSSNDASPALLANGYPYPHKDKFELVKNELLLDNDDAFREAARLGPRPGHQRVRLTQSRKFWTGLERMAQYWDASLDNYFERPASPKQAQSDEEDKMQTNGDAGTPMDLDRATTEKESQKPMVTMYTGRRIGAGNEMPEDIREETIRGFIEMTCWPFGCQVTVPAIPPRLCVKSLLFPVRQTLLAARSPKDRQLARSGILEGPILVAQCRPETSFRKADDTPGSGLGDICDVFREVGAMLLTAQERAREGMTEVKPGEGKWWTTTPRWGGAPNEGLAEVANNSDEKPVPEGESVRKRSKYDHPFLSSRRGSVRKLSPSEKWAQLQAGPSLWDKRMRYMQIGKDKESPFDDIFMLSSINHHLAILHLRVHRRYLEILTTGSSAFPGDSSEQPWHILQLRRTKWFDLMNANDRVEAFQGVWRIFHYLSRN